MFNFKIKNNGIISKKFLDKGIFDFKSACTFVAQLPYLRNKNKQELHCIFDDFGGTCSTKHAVLKKLCLENNKHNVHLILGIFRMDAEYAPKIKSTLAKYQLQYILEAHNYLKIDDSYLDCTTPTSHYDDFKYKLETEIEIDYYQITEDKVKLHKEFLQLWITKNNLPFSLEQIWKIREECILDLQS